MDVNQSDYAFVGRIYPKPGQDLMSAYMEEWDESEDAEVLV
jgi:hypothetical protein